MDVLVYFGIIFSNLALLLTNKRAYPFLRTLKLIPCLGFNFSIAENACSHKYEVEKSNRTFIALSVSNRNINFRFNHNDDNGSSIFSNFFFSIELQHISTNLSRSSGFKSKCSISFENKTEFCTRLTSPLDREGK